LGTPPVPGGSASSPSFSASSPLDASANLTAPEGRATQGRFTLDDWLARARVTIADLRARAVLPIVVGGTHLYVKALLDGLFRGPDPDPALRAELEAMNPAERRAELERVDPTAAARIHPNDARRTVRALEVHRQTGTPISALQTQWDPRTRGVSDGPLAPPTPATEFLLVTLDWETDPLNRRINARVKAMMDHGLLDEVRALVESRRLGPQAREALGYKQLAPLVEHALAHGRWPPPPGDLDDAVEKIKIETRRFAKNQRTWLRRLGATPGALRIPAPATPPDEWPGLVLRALGL
jgi:tRNA dimethylallyltransferase